MFWYSKQEICIKWGNDTSTCFTITNGVRQGRILSPTLFSIYMDDLSFVLSESGIGCHMIVFQHLKSTHIMIILCQVLTNLLSNYTVRHALIIFYGKRRVSLGQDYCI